VNIALAYFHRVELHYVRFFFLFLYFNGPQLLDHAGMLNGIKDVRYK
jgi:hypothetical protein